MTTTQAVVVGIVIAFAAVGLGFGLYMLYRLIASHFIR